MAKLEKYKARELEAELDKVKNKVDKVTGMGLSTNDYTTEEKEKLAGLKNYKAGTNVTISADGTISATGGEGGGTTDYNALSYKPAINGHELIGDMSSSDIDVQEAMSDECEYSENDICVLNANGDKTMLEIYGATEERAGVMTAAHVKSLTDLALNVRKVDAAQLTGGLLESGKTYGSPSSPVSIPMINGTNVTTETVVYYKIEDGKQITFLYAGRLNDAPTEAGTHVVSFENGIAVFGTITTE